MDFSSGSPRPPNRVLYISAREYVLAMGIGSRSSGSVRCLFTLASLIVVAKKEKMSHILRPWVNAQADSILKPFEDERLQRKTLDTVSGHFYPLPPLLY